MTVSEKLRLVQGLHSHAEMFGFNWNDDSDWTWHDVACKIADEIDAENAELRELVRNVEHYERFGCRGCPHSGSCGAGTLYDEDCAMSREIEREKRELGIEVDA